ncbi:hypothetical protein AB3X99_33280 [Paraburkholderia sp. BR10882]
MANTFGYLKTDLNSQESMARLAAAGSAQEHLNSVQSLLGAIDAEVA